MQQTWDSLQYLLSKKTERKQPDQNDRYGLPAIYNQLAASDVNYSGLAGIDFSRFPSPG